MKVLWGLFLSLVLTVASLAGEISGNWKFPSDIAVSNGKLYVVDGLNSRIAVYDLYGTHLGDITVPSPYGIGVGEKGLLYVTSQKKKAIYVLDEYGNLEDEFRVDGRPIDVVEVDGKLFVSNGEKNSIDVYTLDGEFIKRVGGKGTAPGSFLGIFLLDKSKNLLFVVDSLNAKIQEFLFDGDFVRSFGVFGIEEGDLFRPKGVAVCGKLVAVSDGITGAIQLFDRTGGFVEVVAKGLYYPTALACYDGELYVLEPLERKVLTFRLQGVK